MMRFGPLAVATCLAVLVGQPPAYGCSFSWQPGYSPEEIKVREDVRMVRGVFRVGDAFGQVDDEGGLVSGTISGRLETRRGTGWDTTQYYDQLSVECGAYHKPTADARGVFWIERQRKDGRYAILLWEGEYLQNTKPEGGKPVGIIEP